MTIHDFCLDLKAKVSTDLFIFAILIPKDVVLFLIRSKSLISVALKKVKELYKPCFLAYFEI